MFLLCVAMPTTFVLIINICLAFNSKCMPTSRSKRKAPSLFTFKYKDAAAHKARAKQENDRQRNDKG